MHHVDHHAPSLYGAIAEEIRDLRGLIENLAHTLASDEAFVMTYVEQFQVFDLVTQRADECANLLDRMADGSRSHDAIDQVRLSLVQDRLRSALSDAA